MWAKKAKLSFMFLCLFFFNKSHFKNLFLLKIFGSFNVAGTKNFQNFKKRNEIYNFFLKMNFKLMHDMICAKEFIQSVKQTNFIKISRILSCIKKKIH